MQRFTVSRRAFEPAYMALYRSGELKARLDAVPAHLQSCSLCPRNCGVDRLANETGVCKSGRRAVVSSYFPHPGEEDPLRGWRGSGTIFFAWCNLRCVFCQNFEVSQEGRGSEVTPVRLAAMMLELQAAGCHNINFVTPEHAVPQIIEALPLAIEGGLRLPLVYNTSAYDSLESLRLLDGIVDIYMPDFKLWDSERSLRYLKARDYPEVARQAIREMHRQTGDLVVDEHGIALRGLLVRHLVMPEGLASTPEIMRFLAEEVSRDTYVNVMAQYGPAGRVSHTRYAEINRRLTIPEYRLALTQAREAGLWRLD